MANRRNLSRGGWLRRPGDEADGDREELARKLNERGIRGGGQRPQWRSVTHYGIASEDIDYALDVIESTLREYGKG